MLPSIKSEYRILTTSSGGPVFHYIMILGISRDNASVRKFKSLYSPSITVDIMNI